MNSVGIVGYGKIGSSFAQRLRKAEHTVIIYDPNSDVQKNALQDGMIVAPSLENLAQRVKVIFLLIPAGKIVDAVINELIECVYSNTIIIDAGNSNFHDSIRHHQFLYEKGISFLDCGTSGGVHGLKNGFCLMVGGDKKVYDEVSYLLKDLAAPKGYGYMGPAGSGHYVKMVHNGIEYALLQSYAEGLHLLKDGYYANLDLAHITQLWNHGSVIRSFLLELYSQMFEDIKDFSSISGSVQHTGMGQWTVSEAHKENIPVLLIEQALNTRIESQKTGGNYATKLIAVMRNKFGGHKVEGCKDCL